jgi:hypothetical protein
VIRSGVKNGDCFFAIPIAFELQAMLIEPTATIAIAKVIWVAVLKCFLVHMAISSNG